MPSATPTPSNPLSNALLRNILQGEFPENDKIASGELGEGSIPGIIEDLEKAIERAKTEIRDISRQNGREIDSWVSHASKLHEDVEQSKKKAREILKMGEKEKALQQSIHDTKSKHAFLSSEIKFNQSLASILGSLQLIGNTLDQVNVFLSSGELGLAIGQLQAAEHALGQLGHPGIIVVGLMKERVGSLKKVVLERVEECWAGLVRGGKEQKEFGEGGWVKIDRDVKGQDGVVISAEMVIEALENLGLLKAKIDGLHQLVDGVLVKPRLKVGRGKEDIPVFMVDDGTNTVYVSARSTDFSAEHLYSDLYKLVGFLHNRLPTSLHKQFSRIFIPSLNDRLISTYLPTTIPSALSALPQYQDVLRKTTEFEKYLESIHWTLELDLQDWVERASKVWFSKRREDALDATRQRFAEEKVKETVTVERTETMYEADVGTSLIGVSGTDKSSDDSWEQNWSDDDSKEPDSPARAKKQLESKLTAEGVKEREKVQKNLSLMMTDDLGDASGWGLDEDLDLEGDDEGGDGDGNKKQDEADKTAQGEGEKKTDEEDQELEWSEWGEEDDSGGVNEDKAGTKAKQPEQKSEQKLARKRSVIKSPKTPTTPSKPPTLRRPSPREITLRETYTVTGMPEAIMGIIEQLLVEADQLSTNPKYTSTPIVPAASSLLTLPNLVLAAYRALAPIYYSADLSAKMYLYNDCLRIEERLRAIEALYSGESTGLFKKFSLEKEMALISVFGKRWYSKELESQRLILRDYLDGTQGLVACTEYPQSAECTKAITSVVDRIRVLHSAWAGVLSRSALYQSLGSLLTTVCAKIINDIEDMSDISDEESRVLAGYLGEIAKLEEIFVPREGEVTVIALYCANWLKFRYMEQILECTMVDLMYLYNEGQLVDFEKEELVELVKALFADTEKRRRCIEEIRRGPRGDG